MTKLNHKKDYARLAYFMIEKNAGLNYHLSGVEDYDTITIIGDDNWELIYSSIEDKPYEVFFCL